MTIIWLIVWLVKGVPAVVFSTSGGFSPNSWAISLAVCLGLDLIFAVSR